MIYMLGAICLCVISGRFLNKGYIHKTGIVNMMLAGANAIFGVIYSYIAVDNFIAYLRELI